MEQYTLQQFESGGVDCPICQDREPKKREYRNKEVFGHLYQNHGYTQRELADFFDCSRTTIKTWFKNHNVSAEKYEYEMPRGELRRLYLDEKLSISDIADYYDCSSAAVRNRLQNYGIEIRGPGEVSVNGAADGRYKDESHLRESYVERGLSKSEIANECSVSTGTIQYWLNEHEIDVRSYSEAQTLRREKLGAEYKNKTELEELYWEEGLTQREIAETLDCAFTTVQRYMNELDIELRYAGAHGNTYETERGEYVRSTPERQIANWLYENSVQYQYEPELAETSMVPDFYANGVYIEYWGMVNRESYVNRMEEKKARYATLDVDLINLYQSDLGKLEAELGGCLLS